jgi:hypothetical protein
MPSSPDIAGIAALSICESLLLALNDRKVLSEIQIMAVLVDAAAAHSNVPEDDARLTTHTAVAALIQTIIDSGNSVRRH